MLLKTHAINAALRSESHAGAEVTAALTHPAWRLCAQSSVLKIAVMEAGGKRPLVPEQRQSP